MVDVFISYSRANQDVVRRLADAVKALGYAVWWDDELPPHLSYGEVITEKVGQAKAAIVVWSEGSIGSEWVRAEADLARNQKKLIQTALDDCMPPMPFNQIQFASIGGWDGVSDHAGWRKVQASLTALCGPPPAGSPAVPVSTPPVSTPPVAAPVIPPAAAAPPPLAPESAPPPQQEPTQRTQPVVFVAPAPRKGNTLLIAAIAASVAVILVIAGLAFFKNRGPPEAPPANTAAASPATNAVATPPAGNRPASEEREERPPEGRIVPAAGDPEQLLPQSSSRQLTEEDIEGLGPDQLRLARNEIYARNGRTFQDPRLQEHFLRFSWYRPTSDEVTLSAIEQANVDLLSQAERR